MSALWQRLRRWLCEPRIRLPAPGLRVASLRPGDRLQVGSRLWWVEARDPAVAATFELVAAEGPPDCARLANAGERWALETGGRTIELEPAAIIHFPVSSTRKQA